MEAAHTVGLREAKAGLSSLVDAARDGQPAIITRHGRPEAVVVGFEDWKRLSKVPTFAEWLLASPFEPGDIPERDQTPVREIDL